MCSLLRSYTKRLSFNGIIPEEYVPGVDIKNISFAEFARNNWTVMKPPALSFHLFRWAIIRNEISHYNYISLAAEEKIAAID